MATKTQEVINASRYSIYVVLIHINVNKHSKCGSVDYDALDLRDARCKLDPDVTPVARDTKHIHLCLDKLQPDIEAFVKRSSEEGVWSKNGKIITESWLKTGLRDRGITRDLKWGALSCCNIQALYRASLTQCFRSSGPARLF